MFKCTKCFIFNKRLCRIYFFFELNLIYDINKYSINMKIITKIIMIITMKNNKYNEEYCSIEDNL